MAAQLGRRGGTLRSIECTVDIRAIALGDVADERSILGIVDADGASGLRILKAAVDVQAESVSDDERHWFMPFHGREPRRRRSRTICWFRSMDAEVPRQGVEVLHGGGGIRLVHDRARIENVDVIGDG